MKELKLMHSWFPILITSVLLLLGCQVQHTDLELSAATSSRGDGLRVSLEISSSSGLILSSELVSKRAHQTIQDTGRALFEAISLTSISRIYLVVEHGDPLGKDIEWGSIPRVFKNRIQLVEQSIKGKATLWARDWSPLIGLRDAGGAPVAFDFNYSASRSEEENLGADSVPLALAKTNHWERVEIPVYSQGGNFLVDSFGRCHMTSVVLEHNGPGFRGDHTLSAEEIIEYYEKEVGCVGVNIYPRMPYEVTGHIDMWGKFLTEDTIVIPQISKDQLLLVAGDLGRALKAGGVRNYLEERATDFITQGFNVERLPMPLPERGSSVFRTYANSLVANEHVIIPSYERGFETKSPELREYEYIDAHLLEGYENQVAEIYQRHGYTPLFVNSDILISLKGAIHCVAMQVPQFESADSERWFLSRTFLQ